jgi:predicted  nucleic acid-binding Zn-ribbon protein
MTDHNFHNLEHEIRELMKISKQLKESNDHLSYKNRSLRSENAQLEKSVEIAKVNIKKVIKKIKDQK